MLLSSQSIRERYLNPSGLMCFPLISPFELRGRSQGGMTYGLSACGYDCRLDNDVHIKNGELVLASTLEHFCLPNDLCMHVRDKSTWARKGLMVQNTVAEPGWYGYLTVELTYHGKFPLFIKAGEPIAQVQFQLLDKPTDQPYSGRYQGQRRGPQPAVLLKPDDTSI